LKEKARKVFKGLDDDDYSIIEFFYSEKGSSKYEASRYFEGKEAKKPIKQIARATIYRNIQTLKEKGFLEVIGHDKFERGSLKSDIEILNSQTVKGHFAVFGSGMNPHKVLIEPSLTDKSKSVILRKGAASYERMLEFVNNVFDSAIDMNENLTDLKGMHFFHYVNTLLLIKHPDYVQDYIKKSVGEPLGFDVRKMANEMTKLSKAIEKDWH
jgi:hypothetical protein